MTPPDLPDIPIPPAVKAVLEQTFLAGWKAAIEDIGETFDVEMVVAAMMAFEEWLTSEKPHA